MEMQNILNAISAQFLEKKVCASAAWIFKQSVHWIEKSKKKKQKNSEIETDQLDHSVMGR